MKFEQKQGIDLFYEMLHESITLEKLAEDSNKPSDQHWLLLLAGSRSEGALVALTEAPGEAGEATFNACYRRAIRLYEESGHEDIVKQLKHRIGDIRRVALSQPGVQGTIDSSGRPLQGDNHG